MRIGILTFHQSINNGAVMQAYSLSKRLKRDFPNEEVEIINYQMEKVNKSYSYSLKSYLKSSSVRGFVSKILRLLKTPSLLKRLQKRSETFRNCLYKLPLSQECIIDNGTKALYEYINERYDIIVVGSDAVWNYVTRGFPNAYFPDENVKCKKLSYAASCYGMDFLKSKDNERAQIERILNSFSFIGVRDEATENFVSWSRSNIYPVHTCDPTAFLDLTDLPVDEDKLKNKLRDKGFDFNKPTIGVMGSRKMLNMVKCFYGRKYQIVSLYEVDSGADVTLYDLEPYEWAYVFRFFKLVFTTYFHGTLLSLRNGVPLICIDLGTEFGKKHIPKTLDMLKRIGFEDWYFTTDYKSKNYDLIKKKADELLTVDYREAIIKAIDKEAESYATFAKYLKSIIEK